MGQVVDHIGLVLTLEVAMGIRRDQAQSSLQWERSLGRSNLPLRSDR
jgi:hypothetical protein